MLSSGETFEKTQRNLESKVYGTRWRNQQTELEWLHASSLMAMAHVSPPEADTTIGGGLPALSSGPHTASRQEFHRQGHRQACQDIVTAPQSVRSLSLVESPLHCIEEV